MCTREYIYFAKYNARVYSKIHENLGVGFEETLRFSRKSKGVPSTQLGKLAYKQCLNTLYLILLRGARRNLPILQNKTRVYIQIWMT